MIAPSALAAVRRKSSRVMMIKNKFAFFVALLVCMLFCVAPAWGQTAGTGALTVTVSDPSGAVITAATVTVGNAEGLSRTGTTTANGSYTFTLLPAGSYSVSIVATGFKALQASNVVVDVAETHTLEEKLEIGSNSQQVTVTSEVQTVQTESSTLGGVVNSESITELPLVTRNYTQILGLSPGVLADVYNATALGRGSQPTYVGGLDNISNSYLEDETSITNFASAVPADPASFYGSIPIPSPDAIQEFKVQTSLYDASFGRNPGGNVDIITKSGTNDIHGSAFEFFRNDALNANGFFENELGVPRGKLEQNQFGGTLGGPAIKNKLFLFGSYQGTRQINGVAIQGSSVVTLPPQLTNNRTAAALGAEFCTVPTLSFGPPNPPSDQVACDGSNINPVALNILNAKLPSSLGGGYAIPTPTSVITLPSGAQVGQAAFSVPAKFSENQTLFNLDYVINPKNTFSGRYFYAFSPETQAFTNGGGQPPGSGISVLSGNQLFLGKLTTILTSNLVNEVRFSSYYIRASINSLDPFTASSVGTETAASYFNLIPVLDFTSVAGFSSIGGTIVDTAKPPQLLYEWADQISWSHGRHTVRAGYDEQYVNWSQVVPSFNRGQLTFGTFSDFLLGMSAAQNGTGLSNIFGSLAITQLPGGTINKNNENNLSMFVQDDFKVNSRLTLNLGLRWEYDGTAWDSASGVNGGTNPVYALDQTVPYPTAAGTYVGYTVAREYAGVLPAGVLRRNVNLLTFGHAPLDNFSPRIGFAWQPIGDTGKFVVRGGYGIFYNMMQGNAFEIELNNNPPSAAPLVYFGPANALATLADPFNPLPALGFSGFLRTPTSTLSQDGLAPNITTPYVESYNLGIQYEVKPSWVIQIGYAGSHAVHISTGNDLNEAMLATAADPVNCGGPFGCITTNTAANANQRTPVLGLESGGFQEAGNWGWSVYNSLQASLKKTMRNGLQLQASYTYGRSFTDVVGVNLQGGVSGTVATNDPNNLRQAKGPSDFNRPQRLIINYIYDFPSIKRDGIIAQKVLSGWSVSGVATAQTGQPITFIDSSAGAVYGSFETTTQRAELCPDATYSEILSSGSTQSRLDHYFNSAGVFCPPPIVGVVGGVGGATGYGDSKRGPVLGPGQFNWDFALVKNTRVGGLREDANLEFRTEFFNAFNHAQFLNPGSTLTNGVPNSAFGVITGTSVGPRIMQFALKYIF
jgi:hypothetical protein